MSVSCNILPDSNQVIISVKNRFDFSLHQYFRNAYSQCLEQDLNYVLDLSQTDYMDSSALGMILLLKDHVDLYASKLVISLRLRFRLLQRQLLKIRKLYLLLLL